MAMTNHERVGKALDLLKVGLAPFVEREFQNAYSGASTAEAARFLGDDRLNAKRSIEEWDVAALLKLMWEAWNEIFRKPLGFAERSLVSSRRTSPGLVARASSASIRAKAFFPPSCQASSPQRVRTTVPSGLVTGLPGEILFPTKTTRRALGSFSQAASRITASMPTSSLGGRPPNRWYRASMECVLPPPKFVYSCTTGSPPVPPKRRTAPTSMLFRLSVR